ncbi:MAG: hypothetical protein R2724_19415 [Bryobacterales bacterium]
MRILTSRPLLLAVAFAIAALAFWRQIELGVPSTIAYATAVAFAYAARSSKWVWIVAAICPLALLGAMIDQPTAWHDLLARSLFAIWAPAYPCAKALTERAERESLPALKELRSGDAIISQTLDGIVTLEPRLRVFTATCRRR